MKRLIMILSVVLTLVLVASPVMGEDLADIEMKENNPAFSIGVGYIAIPDASGILLEGTVEFTEEFHGFFGLTPFNDGFFFKSLGADYKFSIEESPEIRPGIGVIAVIGEGFSPTASISIVSEEVGEPKINITARGGVNVISGSIGIRF